MLHHAKPSPSMCAFAPSVPLRVLPTQSPVRTACICMKSKRRGAASDKRTKKNKRASAPTTGFANATPKRSEASSATSTDPVDTTVKGAPAVPEIEVERTSGAAGDATPHRVKVPALASAQMENPVDEPLDGPDRPLVPLPTLDAAEIQALRLPSSTSTDELVERFQDARAGDGFAALVVANRHLITERLLYRFTSAILQVEMRKTAVETRMEEAANMRALRQDLIAHCWSLDWPLKVELQNAEARLLSVLQGKHVKQDVARYCGRSRLEVDAFWIVIFAAVAAWEERGRENAKLANVDMQKALGAAAEACAVMTEVTSRLSPSLKAVQSILASSDPNVQKEVVKQLSDEDVVQLGSFTEQIRLFPTAAYGELCKRMASIVDYVWTDKYGIKTECLNPFRFEPQPIDKFSRLVEFSNKSRKFNKSRVR